MAGRRTGPAVGLAEGKAVAVISWVVFAGLIVLALVAAVPSLVQVRALLRCAPYPFETHGAANDPRY